MHEIIERINLYKKQSKDSQFNDYLDRMLIRIEKNEKDIELFNEELDQSYHYYLTQHIVSPKKNKEFIIGISIFSIIGVVFILTAFIMLGINYMNTMARGISLYGICMVIFLVGEMIIKRYQDKISKVFIYIGLIGLFISNVINYNYLYNFNLLIVLILHNILTILFIWYSFKKESISLRILSIMIPSFSLLLFQ